uniref:Uncharacterized protein n=1 Tax=Anguilla anguilla TaxID=7936 RepID=A0A0E9RLY3_ANGAN
MLVAPGKVDFMLASFPWATAAFALNDNMPGILSLLAYWFVVNEKYTWRELPGASSPVVLCGLCEVVTDKCVRGVLVLKLQGLFVGGEVEV